MPLQLRNPHSVLAVLETRPQDVLEVVIPSQGTTDAWEKVEKKARENRVRVSSNARRPVKSPVKPQGKGSKERASDESTRMGVAEAIVQERKSLAVEELFRGAVDRKKGQGLWLALDCLTDPHNVGAIFRAAAFFDVQGILLTQERSAPLTASVYDVASGGMEYVPFVIQPNLQHGFEVAKKSGLWILGTSEHAHDELGSVSKDRPWLLVLGNEEKGMRRLTQDSCDLLCKIPPAGRVTSLNVSVAAGIMISKLS